MLQLVIGGLLDGSEMAIAMMKTTLFFVDSMVEIAANLNIILHSNFIIAMIVNALIGMGSHRYYI